MRSRLKQAELEAEKWAGQFRQLQTEIREHVQAAVQLKQDKIISQENTNRYKPYKIFHKCTSRQTFNSLNFKVAREPNVTNVIGDKSVMV